MTAIASVTLALSSSQAMWPTIASIVVGGVVGLAHRYLDHYGKHGRARTVADVCQAVIDRKVDPAYGASLINAVMGEGG